MNFQREVSTEWIVDRESCQLSPHCHAYVVDRQWVGIDQWTIWIRRVLRDVDTNVNHGFAKSSSPLHSCASRHRSTCIKITCLPALSAPLLIDSVDFQVNERCERNSIYASYLRTPSKELVEPKYTSIVAFIYGNEQLKLVDLNSDKA